MDTQPLSGNTLTAPASSNPALDAARAEFTDIATNPQHSRHAGYQRGERELSTIWAQSCV